MTENKPTQKQIEEARAFLERRLDVQENVKDALWDDFREAAHRIASIVAKNKKLGRRIRYTGTSPMAGEIQEVLDWLESRINDYIRDYAIPEEEEDEDDEEFIMKWLMGEYKGATFEEREELYIDRYIRALRNAGLEDLDIDIDEDDLYDIIMEATEVPSHRLDILVTNTIALGWYYYALTEAVNGGAVGFYVINGKNPCPFCADKSGRLYPITEEIPPYHPSCQCTVVFV